MRQHQVSRDTNIVSGHLKIPQPDNAEEDINGSKESCLGLLNNIYEDGIRLNCGVIRIIIIFTYLSSLQVA